MYEYAPYLKTYILGPHISTRNPATIANLTTTTQPILNQILTVTGTTRSEYSATYNKFGHFGYVFKNTGHSYTTILSAITPTSDYTFEGFMWTDSLSSIQVISSMSPSSGANRICIWIGTDGSINCTALNISDTILYTANSAANVISTNTVFHFSVNRNGSTLTIYVDGVSVATTTISSTFSTNLTQTCYFGYGSPIASSNTIYYGNFYLIEMEIYTNYCKRTTTFTPPTESYINGFLNEEITIPAQEFAITYAPVVAESIVPENQYIDLYSPSIDYSSTTTMQYCIKGYTKINGIIVPNIPITLYIRPAMISYRSTMSDENGYFEFLNISGDLKYLAIALDIDQSDKFGIPAYNAVVLDHITPVLIE